MTEASLLNHLAGVLLWTLSVGNLSQGLPQGDPAFGVALNVFPQTSNYPGSNSLQSTNSTNAFGAKSKTLVVKR